MSAKVLGRCGRARCTVAFRYRRRDPLPRVARQDSRSSALPCSSYSPWMSVTYSTLGGPHNPPSWLQLAFHRNAVTDNARSTFLRASPIASTLTGPLLTRSLTLSGPRFSVSRSPTPTPSCAQRRHNLPTLNPLSLASPSRFVPTAHPLAISHSCTPTQRKHTLTLHDRVTRMCLPHRQRKHPTHTPCTQPPPLFTFPFLRGPARAQSNVAWLVQRNKRHPFDATCPRVCKMHHGRLEQGRTAEVQRRSDVFGPPRQSVRDGSRSTHA